MTDDLVILSEVANESTRYFTEDGQEHQIAPDGYLILSYKVRCPGGRIAHTIIPVPNEELEQVNLEIEALLAKYRERALQETRDLIQRDYQEKGAQVGG